MSIYNGNGMKATGRSSSQRSVYDYPEHLNPFYEDENHKRLRFWKIGSDDKKSGRSNSTFSIDGLKGLWSFKTFKLKKKSSTLGINKTSESPPVLRREQDRYGSQQTIDGGIRHTVDIGLANNFQRGAAYRSSLQDLNSNSRQGDVFFVRNHRYRSTAQPSTSNRYQSNATIGTVTPTFRSKFNETNLSRGSSQLSVNSGNPFDEEYETISQVGSPDRASIRRSGRKKRRAPQPPVSPIQNHSNQSITTVEETNGEGDRHDETVNITNLTAEIESFVRTADTDKEHIDNSPNTSTANTGQTELRIDEDDIEVERNKKIMNESRQSPESNDYYPLDEQHEEITLEKIQNLGSMDVDVTNNSERCKKSPVKILIRAPTDEEPIAENVEKFNGNAHECKDTERETVVVHREEMCKPIEEQNEETVKETVIETKVEEVAVSVEPAAPIAAKEETINQVTEENTQTVQKEESVANGLIESDEASNTTPTSTSVEFILENDGKQPFVSDLRITESTDDLTTIPDPKPNHSNDTEEVQLRPKHLVTANQESKPNRNTADDKTHFLKNFEIRTVPLKSKLTSIEEKNVTNEKSNKRIPPTPPQRRKSVKEIIESINKCQSLLYVKQKKPRNDRDNSINSNLMQASSSSLSSSKICNQKSTFVDKNMNDVAEKQYQEKKMFSDVAEVNNNGNNYNGDTIHIPLSVEEFNNNNSNKNGGVIFEKCVVRGDRKSTDEKSSNVEWNPVPKPRRHRHSQQGSIN